MGPEIKRWTDDEDAILRREALAGRTVAEIASAVGRTESAVRVRAYVLRVLLRPVGPRFAGSKGHSGVTNKAGRSSGASFGPQHIDMDLRQSVRKFQNLPVAPTSRLTREFRCGVMRVGYQ